jgi:hypothetical protein
MRGAEASPVGPPVHSTCCAFEGASRRRSAGATERLLQGYQRPPLHRHDRPVSTPGGVRVAPSAAFGPTLPRAVLVPSSWFLTTATASSTGGSWACCIPLPTLGFIGFPPRRALCRRTWGLPRRCHALQSLPHPYSRTRVSASRCPRAVAGCDPGATGSCSTSRPCSVRAVRCGVCRCRLATARCSPGLPVLEHHVRRPFIAPVDHPKAGRRGCTRADPLGGPCATCMRSIPQALRSAGEGRAARGRGAGAVHEGRDHPAWADRRAGRLGAAPGTRGEPRGTTGGLAGPRQTADHLLPAETRLPGTREGGRIAAAPTCRSRPEASHPAGRRVRAVAGGAREPAARHPCGRRSGNQGGGGPGGRRLRGHPHATTPLREGPHRRGSPLASGSTVVLDVGLQAHEDVSVSYQARAWALAAPGLPVATTPVPGLCGTGRRRPASACSFDPRVSSGGSTAVVCATSARPLAGTRHPLHPSRGKRAGSAARMCPHRPRPAPEVFPMQSVTTAPRGTTRDRPGVFPHALASRPCRASICSMSSRAARPDGRTSGRAAHVWSSAPFVARGCSRARPGRSPCASRHPQATGDQEGHALPRPSPDVAASPRRDPQPATSRPPVQKPHLLPTPTEVVRPAHPGCPREAGREGRARTVSSPAEGARPLARGEAGWPGERVIGAARVAGFRSTCGRGSRERPSPARLACVAGRSCGSITPWAGAGRSEDRRDACSVAASTRGTLVVHASRDAGVRPVPRAEE